jgi:RNA-binding motif X-linked protein 2
MNVIKEINQINKRELENGSVNTPASWHAKYANSAWVYTGNIPTQLSEGDIISVLSQFGEIEDCNLVRDESTGKSKGFAFVKYEDSRSCILAVDNFNGSKLLGRSLRVDHVENYRLPKHIREKEEEMAASGMGGGSTTLQAGHAYEGQELLNSFDINKGQDLFAPVQTGATTSLGSMQNNDETHRIRLKEEKMARKRERDIKRREKESRKEEREEKRRLKRARKMVKEQEKTKHSRSHSSKKSKSKSNKKRSHRGRHDSDDNSDSDNDSMRHRRNRHDSDNSDDSMRHHRNRHDSDDSNDSMSHRRQEHRRQRHDSDNE